MRTFRQKPALLLLTLIFLSGCAPFVGQDQPEFSGSEIALHEGQTIGQTLVARNDGFNGIQIHLRPAGTTEGLIRLHLRSEPGAHEDLASSEIPLQSINEEGFFNFSFPVQSNSRQHYYYLFWELEGTGTAWIGAAGGESYLDGASYVNHQPQDQQTAFRLTYEPKHAILGFIKELIKWTGILLIGIFLYVIPGFALVTLLWPRSNNLSLMVKACLGIGLSLAIYPILFLWTDLIGLHLGSLYAWLPPILGSIILLWKARDWRKTSRIKDRMLNWLHSEALWPDLSLFVIVGLVFLVRFIAVRTLDVPMWGDSYQHTMIAQLLVDNNGLFSSWAPYTELDSFTYHFGFHANVAVFQWITGRSAIRSTLWVGQILNVMAVLALYPLALKVGKSKWAGVVAVLIAGLLSPMPNYFANWGRYTQLAGLCILPIAIFLAWSLIEKRQNPWKHFLIGWILFAGLALTHYRVLIFAMAFFPVIFIQNSWRISTKRMITQIFLLALGAIIIFLPWIVHIWQSTTMQTLVNFVSTPADSTTAFIQQYNTIGNITNYLPVYLWLLMVVSVAYCLWIKSREGLTILLWWTLILLLANPAWINLPGTGTISNFAVFISVYVFSAILIGAGYGWVLQSPWKAWIQPILIGAILISVPYGFSNRYKEIDPFSHSIVTVPDLRAADWIEANTSNSSRFLVNGFFAYGDTLVVGSDGGWWLPMTAHRGNTVPPINYASEEGNQNDFLGYVNDLYNIFRIQNIIDPQFISKLKARGITHVYIGQRKGRVNYSGPHVLQPEAMLLSDNYDLIYHADRVWIFQIK